MVLCVLPIVFLYAGEGGILAAIMSKTLTRSNSENAEIGFSRKKVPETSERIFDDVLGTLLNG